MKRAILIEVTVYAADEVVCFGLNIFVCQLCFYYAGQGVQAVHGFSNGVCLLLFCEVGLCWDVLQQHVCVGVGADYGWCVPFASEFLVDKYFEVAIDSADIAMVKLS